MENEVSGIAKLGIVLIALAVLIGLGFGIFQISKSVANDGVGDVQGELDSVAQSTFTTYDQTTITGTMASSAVSDFEGESVAVLISTQAWTNLVAEIQGNTARDSIDVDKGGDVDTQGSGFNVAYSDNDNSVPVVWAFTDKKDTAQMTTKNSDGDSTALSFINYNAILGNTQTGAAGTSSQTATFSSYANKDGDNTEVNMGKVYFDANCFRCVSGFATTDGGKVIFNNVTSNLSKTGRTEYIPSGAKFESFLVKDASGTSIGVAFQQISGN